MDRPEQSITHSCFGLRGKNVLLAAKACITAGTKQMGCLRRIYLQLFKRLWGELRPVQTTQACPSEGQESGVTGRYDEGVCRMHRMMTTQEGEERGRVERSECARI